MSVLAQNATDASTEHGSNEELRLDKSKTGAQDTVKTAEDDDAQEALCLIVESAAKANDLPLEFFARVIWQESRFQSNAIGPLTRGGQRALGIAQFMPGTASERGLLDPFNPVEALPKAAEFLNELRNRFGNVGLAAAAYNAGPQRLQNWLGGSGGMPQETRNYVVSITGSTLEDWVTAGRNGRVSDDGPKIGCRKLIASLKREPSRFAVQLEQHVKRAILKPWGVQIAAGFNRDQALTKYSLAMKDLSTVVAEQDQPILVRAHGTASFYQVRIGTNTRREAETLCTRIRHASGACLVKRTSA